MSVPLDRADAVRVLRLLDALEDLDDVQDVYANFDIPDEVMAEVS
jgi:transcriptional/translational regulatory protein YebC/TACO1